MKLGASIPAPNPVELTALRNEMSWLGELLGDVIRHHEGEEVFQHVERLRRWARDMRAGDASAAAELNQTLHDLAPAELDGVIRAFSLFLDLANLAEDRQRIRVLNARMEAAFPDPSPESIGDAVRNVLELLGEPRLLEVLSELDLELVLTAHPTEAKRRTVRTKLRRIRELLDERDSMAGQLGLQRVQHAVRNELSKLWQTDLIRSSRPTVMQELNRSLHAKKIICKTVAELTGEMRQALRQNSIDPSAAIRPFVRLGSWVGGDRDGHPYVTTDVTREAFAKLREEALQLHLSSCQELRESLSLSARHCQFEAGLSDAIAQVKRAFPEVLDALGSTPPVELSRVWLDIIHFRLQRSLNVTLDSPQIEAAYLDSGELADDIRRLMRALEATGNEDLVEEEIQPWLDQVEVFGFYLARLDIRQNSSEYTNSLQEIFARAGWVENWSELNSDEQERLLTRYLGQRPNVKLAELSPETQELLGPFLLLHQVADVFGSASRGGHVISMTRSAADVMAILWIWNWTAQLAARENIEQDPLAIVPLFETITDLQGAATTLERLLKNPSYRAYLAQQQDRQVIMIGYSDSTKDGGFLAANWALYEAQDRLNQVARQHQVRLVFFHGRGGSLGRGGGPAAKAILSLPAQTFRGEIRITEQGEVLAERYDNPMIAHRHLEQLAWASIMASLRDQDPIDRFRDTIDRLARSAYQYYRDLVEHAQFVTFFRRVTPISEIEQLPIGSRPSRRKGKASLDDLRAIPWVFSWTQTRALIPAWYGMGHAVSQHSDQGVMPILQDAYLEWPFFTAVIDNAELALAKADMSVFSSYVELTKRAEESNEMAVLVERIHDEYDRCVQLVNQVKQQRTLLSRVAWLAESIRVRNRYIDPLNRVQVELLRRMRNEALEGEDRDELLRLIHLTIKGVASGMRTTG